MRNSQPQLGESGQQKPAQADPVWVKCEGYRCLAVKDQAGQWRTYHNRAPLHGVIEVLYHTGTVTRPSA